MLFLNVLSMDNLVMELLSPCKDCAKLILQSGIKRLVYAEDYKDSEGIDFLKSSGIKVDKIEI